MHRALFAALAQVYVWGALIGALPLAQAATPPAAQAGSASTLICSLVWAVLALGMLGAGIAAGIWLGARRSKKDEKRQEL